MSNTQERPRQRVDMKRRISESGEELCAVCSDVVKFFAVGECDHPICYRCSTRMRVLCEQMYCAICRADLPKIAFTKKREAKFEQLDLKTFRLHHRHKIFFEDDSIKSAFFELQENRCNICEDLKQFKTFSMLSQHMRKEHQLFSCDLCLKHIKIFSKDRKFYDRKTLGEHRRIGDKDDRSHKGHPICKFCDERYLDNDELLRHLRKDHYYCHFCESDGIINEYYDAYNNLRDHFRNGHFLCEEDDCLFMEFTNAFRDEIDVKAHKAAVHRKNLKKAMTKAVRTLDIDFNLAPRGHRRDLGMTGRDDYEGVGRDDRRGNFGHGRGLSRRDRERQREEEDIQRAMTASLNQATTSSVSVVEPKLLAPTTLSNSNDDLRTDKSSVRRNEKPRSDARPKFDKNKSKRSPEQHRRLFEESRKQNVRVSDAPVRGMRDDSDSDSDPGDFRAFLPKSEPPKEPEKKPEPPVEVAPANSLAQKVKLANNFSVQLGGMERDDFPSLGGSKQPKPVDDFPALGGKSSPRASTQNKSKPSTAKSKTRPEDDFPTLGGGSGRSAAKARPQSASSSWAKGAPIGPNKPVTTKVKPTTSNMFTLSHSSSSVSRPKSSVSNNVKQSTSIMNESSSDYPSLSSIGGALLKGKVTGSASEALAKYASSSSATQPITSNVKVVREKPQTETVTVPSAKPVHVRQDFPSLSSSSNDSRDFPTLGGKKNVAVSNTNTAPIWGPKSKPASQPTRQQKSETESGILKLKTKSKKKKEPAPAPAIESSSESLKPEEPLVKEAEFKLPRNKDNSDVFTTKKTKNKKGQQQSSSKTTSEDSQESLKSATESVQNDSDSSKHKTTVDPVHAFLKHLQEEEKKQKDVPINGDAATQSDNKKSKKKKKKKGKSSPENEEDDEFFPGQVKSSENSLSSEVTNKVNFPSSTATDNKFTASSLASDFTDNSAVYQPKIGIISAKPAIGDFPSVHDSAPHVPTRGVDMNDFPALGGGVEKSKVPPPGLNKPKAPPGVAKGPPGVSLKAPPGMSKPPPGFSSSAPPGFNQPSSPVGLSGIANDILSQAAVEATPSEFNLGLNVMDVFQYAKPEDFDIRNRSLITDIQGGISDDRFVEFKRYSGEFRRNTLDAASYYTECSKVLGKKNFDQIFPELLVLLPDITKQQDLLKAHNKAFNSNPVVKLSSRSGSAKTWQQDEKFNTCPVCQQVLLSRDVNDHLDSHGNTADFPALGPTVGKNVFGMGNCSISAS